MMTLLTYMLQYTQYTLEIVSYMLDCARICSQAIVGYVFSETTYMLNYVTHMLRYHRAYTFAITHICFTAAHIYDTRHQHICRIVSRICCDNSSVYDPLETTYMLNYVKYMFRYHRLYTFTITHICFTVVNIYDTQHQYIC